MAPRRKVAGAPGPIAHRLQERNAELTQAVLRIHAEAIGLHGGAMSNIRSICEELYPELEQPDRKPCP